MVRCSGVTLTLAGLVDATAVTGVARIVVRQGRVVVTAEAA